MKINVLVIPFIEKALGMKLNEAQKAYLLHDEHLFGGRRS